MSVNFKSEEIALKEIICSKYDTTKAEMDLIVPDLKPDIGKILQITPRCVITQKTSQQDKAYIQGVIYVTVVYISEEGSVKSIFTELDFSHIIDAKGAQSENHIWAEAEIDSMDYSIVNSRKINLKATLGIDIKICKSAIAALPAGFNDACELQAKYKDFSLCCASLDEDRDFSVKERLEVSSGKADINEIIKLTAKMQNCDTNYADGKIHISGDVCISVLYTSPDGTLCSLDETIPVNEVLENITLPDGDCEGSFTVKDISFTIGENPDSAYRVIDISMTVGGSFKTVKAVNISAISDAFSTKEPVSLIKNTYDIENILDKSTTRIAHKETVSVPEYLPEIYKVLDLCGKARLTGISIEDGRINIEGEILSDIMYMSVSEEAPVSGFCHISSFSQSIDISCADQSSICEAKAELDHITYSIKDDKSLELRFIVLLTLTVLKGDTLEIIEDIKECEDAAADTLPPVIICFSKDGDTVWDIAKRYMATPEEIIKTNNLEDENLKEGQKICIFRM